VGAEFSAPAVEITLGPDTRAVLAERADAAPYSSAQVTHLADAAAAVAAALRTAGREAQP
jgi:hypothetical protein